MVFVVSAMIYGVATAVRMVLLLNAPMLVEWLQSQREFSTPLTSWKRVTEGVALMKADVSPYTGDLLHESPLILRFLSYFLRVWPGLLNALFIATDLLIALLLDQMTMRYFGKFILQHQKKNCKEYNPNSASLLLTASNLRWKRLYVLVCYLFNPYVIGTCLSKSTAVFNNLALVMAFYFTLKGSRFGACLSVAAASHISLYPVVLIVPASMHIAREEVGGNSFKSAAYMMSVAKSMILFVAFTVFLLWICFMLEGSSLFIYSTYGFIFNVPDLAPNVGIFWYFFTEMFDHFRLFFICVFQIHAFIYTIPLSIRLRDHTIFLMYILLAITSIFKSYPSYGDAALYLALLPLWSHVLQYTRNLFIAACMLVVCTVMAPVLWYLWIYSGSANANFYFAITLAYTTAQVFLVTDVLFGYLRREFHLKHGIKPTTKDGKLAKILLN
ncbi:GPI-anchor transamidase component PIGU-like [Tubulanus polymorphus]|uniref:GPI-anchor transamidase component PIGU-like n=1 Tax=Tubulanus polymorphus TaxID=672921 RepID=UPI003DA6A536